MSGKEIFLNAQSEKTISTVGRYHVNRELGRGGMGVVFLGQDPFIERQVAIKTPKVLPPVDAAEFECFTREFLASFITQFTLFV